MRTPEGWPCRRSIRLKGFDYSQAGSYFVTIGTQDRLRLLGRLSAGRMRLSPAGQMVARVWRQIPLYYPGVSLDAFVFMPDHMHGIVVLGARGAQLSIGLSEVVHRFKSLTTARYRHAVRCKGWPPFPGRLWHRNYYERIIRDESALRQIRRYIANNPRRLGD